MNRQPKEKTKTKNQRKLREKKPNANITQSYEMMINNNKENLRQKNNLLPQIG